MSIVSCKECGHKISDSSRRCPNCGAKYSDAIGYDYLQKTARVIFSLVLILLGISFLILSIRSKISPDWLSGVIILFSLFLIIFGILLFFNSLLLKQK